MLRMAVVLSFGLLVAGASARVIAAASVSASAESEVEQAVVAAIPAWQGQEATVLRYLDLTGPFHSDTPWAFVVARDPHQHVDGFLGAMNPLALCFVHGRSPRCVETQSCGVVTAGEPEWYRAADRDHKPCTGNAIYDGGDAVIALRVVYAGARTRHPLLLLKTGDSSSADGNRDVQTVLYRYSRTSDRFQPMFVNDSGGSNNNQDARFVAHGPLRGDEIVDYPTERAPFAYWIEVYAPRPSGTYRRVLRYRGHTGYGDGNPLPVADSEMPEIMERLGVWKPDEPLPVPKDAPADCGRLVLRYQEEWCSDTLRAEAAWRKCRAHGGGSECWRFRTSQAVAPKTASRS